MSLKLNDVLTRIGAKRPSQAPPPAVKQKVLVWSDSVLATTGFGRVSDYILKALYNTGKYEIDQLAINHFAGAFYDRKKYPYNIQAAKVGEKEDPYGNKLFLNILQHHDYDIVFVINDTFVVESVAQSLQDIRRRKAQLGKKVFNLVYYYPVDCCFLERASTMVKIADRAVAYTQFAADETRKVLPNKPDEIIYHGTDTSFFKKLTSMVKHEARSWLHCADPDTFLLISVNRNSVRKDIARTILAFSEFRKKVPNSVLYLHTKMQDGVGGLNVDLTVPVTELGLSFKKDVIFPTKLHAAQGFPPEQLLALYNAADAFITTNLGEGWGLSITEAMAVGLPVIAPLHTSAHEILGHNQERGYTYECKEQIYVDNSGFRPFGYLEDILEQMYACHEGWKSNSAEHNLRLRRARMFTEQHSWENVCKQWVDLFDNLQEQPTGLAHAGWEEV
jgi:glycosyltransferase involved in cell wall biosynthesis